MTAFLRCGNSQLPLPAFLSLLNARQSSWVLRTISSISGCRFMNNSACLRRSFGIFFPPALSGSQRTCPPCPFDGHDVCRVSPSSSSKKRLLAIRYLLSRQLAVKALRLMFVATVSLLHFLESPFTRFHLAPSFARRKQ